MRMISFAVKHHIPSGPATRLAIYSARPGYTVTYRIETLLTSRSETTRAVRAC